MRSVVRRDEFGVLLNYELIGMVAPQSTEAATISDRERCIVLKAEHEVRAIETMIALLEDLFSEAARARLWYSVRAIDAALQVQRRSVGMTAGIASMSAESR